MSLPIADDHVVSIHYTLTNNKGEILDSSSGSDPLTYLHGGGNIIPGLEKALLGKKQGDALKVKVEPEEGYGVRLGPSRIAKRTSAQEIPELAERRLGLVAELHTHIGDLLAL